MHFLKSWWVKLYFQQTHYFKNKKGANDTRLSLENLSI